MQHQCPHLDVEILFPTITSIFTGKAIT